MDPSLAAELWHLLKSDPKVFLKGPKVSLRRWYIIVDSWRFWGGQYHLRMLACVDWGMGSAGQ
eukprot:771826-Lingulodinium_polyedra.AAC.1